jgi:hypothetical protein
VEVKTSKSTYGLRSVLGGDGIDLLQLDKFVILQYFLSKARLLKALVISKRET